MDSEFENRQNVLKSSILGDLPEEELAELARRVKTRLVLPKEFVYSEGDPPDAFYIVYSGQVRIFVRRKNGLEREFAVRGAGEHFGEVSLLTGEQRTANVESLVETRLLAVSREQFDRLLRDYPEISRKFVREMRDWLLEDQKIIEKEADALLRSSRASYFDFLLVLGISFLLALTFNFLNPRGIPLIPPQPEPVPAISAPVAMREYEQKKAVIVDAMPNHFFKLEHIKGALNLPPAQFDLMYMASFSRNENKDRDIIVYGSTVSGPYDLQTANKLILRGYRNVRVLAGGLEAWEANGYPVEKKGSR